MLDKLWCKVQIARKLPISVLVQALVAWILIQIADLAIRVIPFSILSRICGSNVGPVAYRSIATPKQEEKAGRIGHAIRIAAGNSPLRSDCLRQALVAVVMTHFRRLPCILNLGVENGKVEKEIRAHAWTHCGRIIVTGGANSFMINRPLACYLKHGQGFKEVQDERSN